MSKDFRVFGYTVPGSFRHSSAPENSQPVAAQPLAPQSSSSPPALRRTMNKLAKAPGNVVRWLAKRPQTVTFPLPGTANTLERPSRVHVPEPTEPAAGDPAIAQAEEVCRQAEDVLRRLTDSAHGLEDRPGGATTRWEKGLTHLPFLRPKPIAQMQTLQPKPLSKNTISTPQQLVADDLQQHVDSYHRAFANFSKCAQQYNQAKADYDAVDQEIAYFSSGLAELRKQNKALRKRTTPELSELPDQPSASVANLKKFAIQRQLAASLNKDIADMEDALRERKQQLPALAQARQQAVEKMKLAKPKVLEAATRLQSSVTTSKLRGNVDTVLAAEAAAKRLNFVHSELDRLAGIIRKHLDKAQQDKSEFDQAIMKHAEMRTIALDGYQKAISSQALLQHNKASLESELTLAIYSKTQAAFFLEAAKREAPGEEMVELEAEVKPSSLAALLLEAAKREAPGEEMAELEAEVKHFSLLEEELRAALEEADRLAADADRLVDKLFNHAGKLDEELDTLMRSRASLSARSTAAEKANVALQAAKTVAEQQNKAVDEQQEAKKVFDGLHAKFLEIMLLRPPGFGASRDTERLGQSMRIMLDQWPENPSSDALPKVAVAEITSRALAQATGGDAERADKLLQTLRDTPTLSFLTSEDADGASSSSAVHMPPDIKALIHLMVDIPRGMEILHMMGRNDVSVMPGKQLVALRAYWQADKAIQAEGDAKVRAWLNDAKQVAKERLLHADAATLEQYLADRFDPRQLGAYNAVRNGFLSNAEGTPYDENNKRLLKMTNEWMERRQGILSRKMPFDPDTLSKSAAMADRFGINTHGAEAAKAIYSAAASLATIAETVLTSPQDEEVQRINLAVSVLGEYMKEKPVSLRSLTPADFKAIRDRFNKRLGTGGARQELPGVLGELAKDAKANARTSGHLLGKARAGVGVSAEEIVRTVTEEFLARNADRLNDEQASALANGLGLDAPEVQENFQLSHQTRFGRRQMVQFGTKENLLKFWKPMLKEWGLRDKLKLSAGGALGAGLPFLPYASPILASPTLTGGYTRKAEAFFQVFQPILGIEMTIGDATTHSWDASLGVAVGAKIIHGTAGGSATLSATRNDTTMNGTIVRFLRSRGQDDLQRENMLTALESIVMWDSLEAVPGGGGFAGPMEALLSRSPDAVVTRFNASTVSLQGEFKISGSAKTMTPKSRSGARTGLGISAYAKAKVEKSLELRSEDKAAVYVVADKTSTGKQAFNAGGDLQVPLPQDSRAYPLKKGGKKMLGSLQGGSMPGLLSLDREMRRHMEKHGISPFRINDKQDGDLDRHYAGAKEMLAEIAVNREQWLARCLETLPEIDGAKDTPENRALAQQLLDRFEQDIRKLDKASKFCQFNVNYSMRSQAAAWIDSLRAIGELAKARGDEDAARAAAEAVDEVLHQPSTWRPLMLIVREKGKVAKSTGINYGLRAQQTSSIEGQRTALQFPPP